MNIKMTMNSQLSTIESKKQKQKQAKQTSRTGTESWIWGTFGGLSAGRGKGESGGNAQIKKHNWQEQNRQGDVKNSIGKGEAEELTGTTHGHELRGAGDYLSEGGCWAERAMGKKM